HDMIVMFASPTPPHIAFHPASSNSTNPITLSFGPSRYSCTCECWSVVPSALIGVNPANTVSPCRSLFLPSDSAHNCLHQSASRYISLAYGLITWLTFPLVV